MLTQNLLSNLFWSKFDASVINSCCCICVVCLTRTRSLYPVKREFFSMCVISLSFFTPVQRPWVPTGQTLIDWTFQKLQRQKWCPCDQTVQTRDKRRQQESELTGFLTLLAIFSFYFLQDLIYHLNSSYKKCITTVPEDVTRIILHKREKKNYGCHLIIYKRVNFLQ